MMRHYEELAKYERDGFDIVVDKTYEDLNPRDCFDDECHDIAEICRDINSYKLDWFMLRVRVFFDCHEMGSHYLGGCLYEDAKAVLTDGTAEDCISAAMDEAKQEIVRLREKLADLVV
jgi:hypothetical protein